MRNTILLLLAGGSLVLAGCGSNYSAPPSPTPTPTPGPGGNATTIEIAGERGNQSFSPNPAAVDQGSTVAWHNADNTTHHLVAVDGSFDTGNIAPGASSAPLALTSDGANYYCTIHPTMVGSIRASNGQPPPCQGQYCSSSQ